MPDYYYKGLEQGGKVVTGHLEAANRRQAMQQLKLQKIKALKLSDVGSGSQGRQESIKQVNDSFKPIESSMSKPGLFSRLRKGQQLALPFLEKLFQLHSNGMPVGDAIQLMSNRMADVPLKELCTKVYKDLSEGRTLAASMRAMPEVFDPTFSYLIEAGEATGNVAPILDNVIISLKQRSDLKRKVKAAMAYPILICVVAIGVIGLFLFFLLPRIESMMASLGGQLNLAARVIIGFSDFALTKGPFIIGILVIAFVIIYQWRKSEKGRIATDRWLLQLPLLKSLFYHADICRVTNILAILLKNGVNTTESLRLAENTLSNRTLLARFHASRILINDGASFSAAYRKQAFLPDIDVDILSIGENTGNMAFSFAEIYKTHALELELKLKRLTNVIAGGALTFAFTLVFVLTLGIVLSILSMNQSLLGQ